jgi:hypothetical protein
MLYKEFEKENFRTSHRNRTTFTDCSSPFHTDGTKVRTLEVNASCIGRDGFVDGEEY